MAQALPVLIKVPEKPGKFRQITILRKRSRLIKEEELSPHCHDLFERGYLAINRTGRPDAPVAATTEKKAEPMALKTAEPLKVEEPRPAKTPKKSSRSQTKKGRK